MFPHKVIIAITALFAKPGQIQVKTSKQNIYLSVPKITKLLNDAQVNKNT